MIQTSKLTVSRNLVYWSVFPMRKHRVQGLVLAFFLGVVQAVAGPSTVPRLDFTDQRLENGLRVLIAPDHSAPVFSI